MDFPVKVKLEKPAMTLSSKHDLFRAICGAHLGCTTCPIYRKYKSTASCPEHVMQNPEYYLKESGYVILNSQE